MANKKITALTAITGANTAATDVFVVVDVSAADNFKITRAELWEGLKLDAAGTTFAVTSLATPAITTASGALTVTPAAGSGMAVVLSTTGDFSVNTTQLVVDTSTGRIGIGTASPACAFHLVSTGEMLRIVGGTTQYYSGTDTPALAAYSTTNRIFSVEGGVNDSDSGLGVHTVLNNYTPGGGWSIVCGGVATSRFFISSDGNVGVGQVTFGANATNAFALSSGVAPTTSPADAVQVWSADRGAAAGKAGLHIRSEDGTSYVLSDRMGIGTVTPTVDVGISGNAARTVGMERHTTANTAGNPLILQGGGATSGATDKDGGRNTLAPGLSTGTGMSSVRLQRLSRASATGTSDNTLYDAVIVGSQKHITGGAATSLFEVALPAGASIGGMLKFSIHAADAANNQVHSGFVTFAAARAAAGGAANTQITDVGATGDANAKTSGTDITDTWGITDDGSTKVTITLNAVSSLTETSLYVCYTIFNESLQAVTQL